MCNVDQNSGKYSKILYLVIEKKNKFLPQNTIYYQQQKNQKNTDIIDKKAKNCLKITTKYRTKT